MNESQTRLDKIDPKLKESGWSVVEDSRILTECIVSRGKITTGRKPSPLKADYVLQYKGAKLAVIEAKSDELSVVEGVAQAKEYADKLCIKYTYSTNGDKIYAINMETGEEGEINKFPTPQELWRWTFGDADEWRDKFYNQPFYTDGSRQPRYYQEIAVNKALDSIADGQDRILLTLATGTGKTFITFQIAYKLFETRWNVKRTGTRPRILFLADRNILANQAFNGFGGFSEDALVRIRPETVRKKGRVPTNGSVFFTIFQTFISGDGTQANFGQYPSDFFDLIIIDECHRGGARDESNWRQILEYFDSAVQIGLTATPRRDTNADTYRYFGDPVYQYSLKQGINDGYLTPFRHCKMQSNIDDYIYSPEDEILSGEVEEGKTYTERDFYNGDIKIRQRDEARVLEFMSHIGREEKTLVFCATQDHAGQIRDMINAVNRGNPKYCVRVTANDGSLGELYLSDFQDNEKTIPTILTTSQKLSTGVDALNVRNIVLLRPIHSMIEFKQIIGRGTRLYDGKYYFTIYDFVKAYENFNDPSWDGDPVCSKCGNDPCTCEEDGRQPQPPKICSSCEQSPCVCPPTQAICPDCGANPCVCQRQEKLQIRLSDNRARQIRHIKTEMFWGADGKPVSAEEFLQELFGKLPEFFSSKDELHLKWSDPRTRQKLLDEMGEAGYGKDILSEIRHLIDADKSDLLDVLEYIAYATTPIERKERAIRTEIFKSQLNPQQQEFVDFLTLQYVLSGIEELESDKLPKLLERKFGSIPDGVNAMGGATEALKTFYDYQKALYI